MKTAFAALASLCISGSLAGAEEKIVVSTFATVLTEIVEKVGGERVELTGHIQPGVDPHQFELKPADLQIIARAQLVLLSEKHMESYIDKLKESTGGKALFLEIGATDRSAAGRARHAHRAGEKHSHEHHADDPHWWHSIALMQKAVRTIAGALGRISPNDAAFFSRNAETYDATLAELLNWARREIAGLPRNKRKLVTSHDAFQYFAREHGFTIHAIEGFSSAEQASSKRVAEIIRLIKAEKVKAIFAEDFENPKVLEEIVLQTGVKLGGTLFADGLGTGEASTYEGMYRHNVTTIVAALR